MFIYSKDGSQKVNIDTATLLGDVARDKNIYRQGDNSQLWRSKSGAYFKGMCLHHARGAEGTCSFKHFIPLSREAAKTWVLNYYGASDLARFGFTDDAEEI